MKFPIKRRVKQTAENYFSRDVDVARKFARIIYKEFGTFISAIVLFGSTTRNAPNPKKDIDILIILDDVRVKFTKDLVQTYRIITEKAAAQVDPQRLHVQSMKFTSFWEYIRAGDPVAINVLRQGVSLMDTGFFDPLQVLLEQGRIRPSSESVYTYFTMAPASLSRSKDHILAATVDLYWATIDAAHAALMKAGEIPPTPEHVSDLLEQKLVKDKHISKSMSDIMRRMYVTYKKILRREIFDIPGKEYDKLKSDAELFVKEMKRYIEKK